MARKPNSPRPSEEGGTADRYDGYDILVINSLIEDPLFGNVLNCVMDKRKSDKLVCCVVTYGGQANVAYRIGRLLQGIYKDVAILAPSLCKSAGTLIAVSGNTLIMSPFGEIGPLDVQLLERDELNERKSGLTMRSALEDLKAHSFELFHHFMTEIKTKYGEQISFKLASELAGTMATALMDKVYAQIHPDVIGKDFRDLSVATKYCERLNVRFSNIKHKGIGRLVHEYPSHDFVIDYDEAKEIFERVELPSPRLVEFINRSGNRLLKPNVRGSFVEMEPWSAADAAGNEDGDKDGDLGRAKGEDSSKGAKPVRDATAEAFLTNILAYEPFVFVALRDRRDFSGVDASELRKAGEDARTAGE